MLVAKFTLAFIVNACSRTILRVLRLAVVLVVPTVAFTFLSTIPAAAQVPGATYNGSASDPGSNATLSSPGGASNDYTDPDSTLDSSSYSISLAGTPDPQASANVAFTDTPAGDVTASAQVFYYFEVLDSTSTTSQNPVTVDVTAGLSASSFGAGVGGSIFNINQVSYISGSTVCSPGTPCLVQSWFACAGESNPSFICGGAPALVSVNTTESLFSNTEYVVELSATAGAYLYAPPGPNPSGTGGGFVDPEFGIDPTTANATHYSLIFSSGIGNAAPVPEPETCAMMMAGLGMIGFIARRRTMS
ncbi:MAG: PEP-CTERM sorting domain-containing protein [Thiobacillaceae bacterium]